MPGTSIPWYQAHVELLQRSSEPSPPLQERSNPTHDRSHATTVGDNRSIIFTHPRFTDTYVSSQRLHSLYHVTMSTRGADHVRPPLPDKNICSVPRRRPLVTRLRCLARGPCPSLPSTLVGTPRPDSPTYAASPPLAAPARGAGRWWQGPTQRGGGAGPSCTPRAASHRSTKDCLSRATRAPASMLRIAATSAATSAARARGEMPYSAAAAGAPCENDQKLKVQLPRA